MALMPGYRVESISGMGIANKASATSWQRFQVG